MHIGAGTNTGFVCEEEDWDVRLAVEGIDAVMGLLCKERGQDHNYQPHLPVLFSISFGQRERERGRGRKRCGGSVCVCGVGGWEGGASGTDLLAAFSLVAGFPLGRLAWNSGASC